MEYNQIIGISYIISAIPSILIATLYYSNFKKTHISFLFHFGLAWSFIVYLLLMSGIGILFSNQILIKISFIGIFGGTFSWLRGIKTITLNRFYIISLYIITITTTIFLFLLCKNRLCETNLNEELAHPENTTQLIISMYIYSIALSALFLGYIYNIYRNAPLKMKKEALFLLIGTFLMTIASFTIPFTYLTQFNISIFGAIFIISGAIIIYLTIRKNNIIYLMVPLKIHKISITTINGYNILWNVNFTEKGLHLENEQIKKILSASESILKNTIENTKIQSLKFDEDIISIISIEKMPFSIMIIISEPTISLEQAFRFFTIKIVNKIQNKYKFIEIKHNNKYGKDFNENGKMGELENDDIENEQEEVLRENEKKLFNEIKKELEKFVDVIPSYI